MCQSSAWFSPTASGENRNCPNELAAVPIPKESERQLNGSSFPNAPITTVKDVPASPKPIRNPAETISAPCEVA